MGWGWGGGGGSGDHGWHVLKAELRLGLAVLRVHQVALPAYWHPAKYLTLFSSLNGICHSADQGYRSSSSLNAFQVLLLNLNNQIAGEETGTRELPGDFNAGHSPWILLIQEIASPVLPHYRDFKGIA